MRIDPALKIAMSVLASCRIASVMSSVSSVGPLRTADSVPRSGRSDDLDDFVGFETLARNAAKPASVHFRTSAAVRGSSFIVSSTGRSVVVGASARERRPRGMRSVTTASVRTFESALTIGVKCSPALDDPVLVLVAAEDQVDLRHLLGKLLVAGEGQVGERDDGVAACLFNSAMAARADSMRRRVADPRLLVDVDREAEEADAHACAPPSSPARRRASPSRERLAVLSVTLDETSLNFDSAMPRAQRGLAGCRTRGCRTWPSPRRPRFSTADHLPAAPAVRRRCARCRAPTATRSRRRAW